MPTISINPPLIDLFQFYRMPDGQYTSICGSITRNLNITRRQYIRDHMDKHNEFTYIIYYNTSKVKLYTLV